LRFKRPSRAAASGAGLLFAVHCYGVVMRAEDRDRQNQIDFLSEDMVVGGF
jgi:hypothetical protein